MGRSAGFNLGGTYSSHRPQQQQQHAPSVSSSGVSFSSVNNQDLLHLHGSDMFPSSHSAYHSQVINEFLSHSVIGFEMTNKLFKMKPLSIHKDHVELMLCVVKFVFKDIVEGGPFEMFR
jgi:hypothetical protein